MLRIGPIEAKSGERVDAWYAVCKKPDGSDITVPLIIVNGSKKGPVLYVQGGIHGDELEGPAAIMDVANSLKPKELKGTFIGVPVVNIAGYLHKISVDVSGIRENPYDWKNMNRVGEGKEDGTTSDVIMYTISKKLKPLADVTIDIHSGGQRGTSIQMAGFTAAEGEYMTKTLELAELFPFDKVWREGPRGRTRIAASEVPSSLNIALEVTGQGRCEDCDVEPIVTGIRNIMKHLGMITGKPEGLPKSRKYVDTETYIYAKVGGLLRPKVATGDLAKEGETIGLLYDVHGHITEKVRAPFDCIVTGIRTKGIAWLGEPVFLVSSFIPNPREKLVETRTLTASQTRRP